ncbi:hypothetical protein [Massilia sp. SYSU DXS3249]
MSDHENKHQAIDWITIGATIAVSSVLIPLALPNEITLSPFLLFSIIFVTNVSTYLVPEDISKRKVGIFAKAFFTRLLISLTVASLLIFISYLASRL